MIEIIQVLVDSLLAQIVGVFVLIFILFQSCVSIRVVSAAENLWTLLIVKPAGLIVVVITVISGSRAPT